MKNIAAGIDKILLALFIFFIPVMINSPAYPILPQPIGGRIQISELIFILLFTFWFIGFLKGRYRIERTKLDIPILFYLVVAFLSMVNSHNKLNAGFEFIGQLYLAAIFFILVSMIKDERDFDFALKVLLISASFVISVGAVSLILVGVFGVEFFYPYAPAYSGSTFPYIGNFVRVRSTLFPTTKMLANYLVLTLGFLASKFLMTKENLIRNTLLAIFAAGIIIFIFTISRDIAGFLFALVVFLCMFQARDKRNIIIIRRFLFIAALLVFIAVNLLSVIYIDSYNIAHKYEKEFKLKGEAYSYLEPNKGIGKISVDLYYLFDHYFWLKRVAWRIFLKHPFIGSGLDDFRVNLRKLVQDGVIPPRLINYKSAQSTPMTILAERGLLGLASLFFIWVAILLFLFRLWRTTDGAYSKNITAAFTAGIVGIFINSINVDIMNFRFLWLIFALIFAYGNIILKKRGQYE